MYLLSQTRPLFVSFCLSYFTLSMYLPLSCLSCPSILSTALSVPQPCPSISYVHIHNSISWYLVVLSIGMKRSLFLPCLVSSYIFYISSSAISVLSLFLSACVPLPSHLVQISEAMRRPPIIGVLRKKHRSI
jgi:phosphoglycerol transferase MdoB-like AlkP superfamily enzyme